MSIGTPLRPLLLLVLLVAARDAAAQTSGGGTISDPPAEFVRPVSAFDSSPAARFIGVSTDLAASHVFEMGWWYRVAGDDRERPFPTPNDEDYVGDTSTVTWNDVHGRGFRAVETGVVANGGGPSGQVILSLTLTNLSATTPLSIDVFNMADLDLGETTGGDTATLLGANERIGIADTSDSAEYGALSADAFLVLTAQNSSGLPDVAARLSDLLVDVFDNTGLPFGPDDITAGFQWTTTVIPPSGSATFVAGIAVNMALTFPGAATTTSTITTASTTTTTLGAELCDNCTDDDGDTQVDFEDEDCCPTPATSLTLRKSAIRPGDPSVAKLRLTARLSTSPVAEGTVPTQDITIQLRDAAGAFCARVPAGSLVRRPKGLTFRGNILGARGVERITLLEKRRSVKLAVSGSHAQLDVPPPGAAMATLGLRDPATAEVANRCAAGAATFRAAKRGVRYP